MSHHDAIRDEAVRRLERQADLTAYSARRFAEAARQGDLDAARRWRHEYQLSAACCRALGSQARGEPFDRAPSDSGAAATRSPAIRAASAAREWTPSFS
jgi:hypothetical protein